jgi:dTDP-4-dehydrorhamnose reductase
VRILLLGANGQLGRTFLDHGGLAARGELTIATRDGALAHGGHGETADLSIPASLPALLDRV